MIRAFHAISTFLLISAIGFLLYNLIWQFAANGQVKILSIKELWSSFDKASFQSATSFSASYVSPAIWTQITNAPAALVLLGISIIFYLPTRLLMFFGLGKKRKDWRDK